MCVGQSQQSVCVRESEREGGRKRGGSTAAAVIYGLYWSLSVMVERFCLSAGLSIIALLSLSVPCSVNPSLPIQLLTQMPYWSVNVYPKRLRFGNIASWYWSVNAGYLSFCQLHVRSYSCCFTAFVPSLNFTFSILSSPILLWFCSSYDKRKPPFEPFPLLICKSLNLSFNFFFFNTFLHHLIRWTFSSWT